MQELYYNGKLILGVDHGYGNMKTAHRVFAASVEKEVQLGAMTLEYKGKEYGIGGGHKEFRVQKIQDEDYWILTLAAVAEELKFRGMNEAVIHLAAGVPLFWVKEQIMNLTYEKCGDYLIPNLIPDPEPEGELKKFGLMRRSYLENHRSGIYSGLLLSGKLKEHLLSVQEQAEEMFDLLVEQMAEKEGVTERLKAQDQMLWVQRMNCIRARAEEIVREEIIYCL